MTQFPHGDHYAFFKIQSTLRRSPELHPAVDQSQRDEVLLAILAIVEQDAGLLGGSELHGDADRVVGAHGLEGQVGLAPK